MTDSAPTTDYAEKRREQARDTTASFSAFRQERRMEDGCLAPHIMTKRKEKTQMGEALCKKPQHLSFNLKGGYDHATVEDLPSTRRIYSRR